MQRGSETRQPRQRFVCTACGLRIVGRLNPRDGLVYAYDRSATDDTVPPQACVCISCAEDRKERRDGWPS
jgi:hypothetical protein